MGHLQGADAVLFDLDDTVFSTNDRHLRILREYADLRVRDP